MLKCLWLLQQNHTAEKIKQSKTYKRQVKELNEQISLMKRREHDKARLEGLMKKSEDMVHRLRTDITRIKNQKSSLERQIQVRSLLAFGFHCTPYSKLPTGIGWNC